MYAMAAKAAKWLIKSLAADPGKLIKFFLLLVFLPLAFIVMIITAPLILFSGAPAASEDHVEMYKRVVEEIDNAKDVSINENYLIAIDAVIFDQEFSDVSKRHMENIAERFVDEDTETKYRQVEVECEDDDSENNDNSDDEDKEGNKDEEEKCYGVESYEVTVYNLRDYDDVLDDLIDDGILEEKDVAQINRYLQSTGANHTINPDELPEISDGAFMRPATGPISSGFGGRWGEMHYGTDIARGNRSGVPIVASADGEVRKSYNSSSYGEVIIITHQVDGQQFETLYAHMVRGSRKVRKGDDVNKGDPIGIMGTTGESTGPHLHFELHLNEWNGLKSNAVNAAYYVEF